MTKKKGKKAFKVTFWGCSQEQATWGGGADPRELLEEGKTYEVVKTEVYDWHTHYYIVINGKEIPFNSSCFGENNKIKLPQKITTMIVDTDNVFLVRIETEPRTTDTGIANIIPIDKDISRRGRDRTIQIAEQFVARWNAFEGGGLVGEIKQIIENQSCWCELAKKECIGMKSFVEKIKQVLKEAKEALK